MSRVRTYAQLVRLPNVFTAVADIALGALAAGALPARWLAFLVLALTSACLYSAGMVWNDYFDVEQDKKERPLRPLPSGRISPGEAARFGAALFASGLLLALGTGWLLSQSREPDEGRSMIWTPFVLALFLIAAILLYDGWLKRTAAGPIGMGTCRFLNVLLGLSIAGSVAGWRNVHLAAVVGIYIAGVTWFARTEARMSNQRMLSTAACIMLAGLLLALPLPLELDPNKGPNAGTFVFPYLLVALGFLVGLPVSQAIVNPTPPQVQAAVKRAIMGLVVLDAALSLPFAGLWGLLILTLLVPALYLGRWIYST
jgi:4-hydroxybenzoate polyprenyltransferase